jgi:hypothetical protein
MASALIMVDVSLIYFRSEKIFAARVLRAADSVSRAPLFCVVGRQDESRRKARNGANRIAFSGSIRQDCWRGTLTRRAA